MNRDDDFTVVSDDEGLVTATLQPKQEVCGDPSCLNTICRQLSYIPAVIYTEPTDDPTWWHCILDHGFFIWGLDKRLMHITEPACGAFEMYRPKTGKWQPINEHTRMRVSQGCFFIFRRVKAHDNECPSLARFIRRLHYKFWLAAPFTDPYPVPAQYQFNWPRDDEILDDGHKLTRQEYDDIAMLKNEAEGMVHWD